MKNLKLSYKITLLCTGLLALGAISNTYVFTKVVEELSEDHRKAIEIRRTNLANSIATQMYERYGDVQAFTYNQVFRGKDQEAMVEVLNRYAAAYGIYDLIMFVDRTGKLVAVNDLSPDGKPVSVEGLYQRNYSKENWFNSTLKGETTNDPKNGFKGTLVEAPHTNPLLKLAYNSEKWSNTFTAIVEGDSGQAIGIIHNVADFRWVGDEVQSIYDMGAQIGYTADEFILMDQKGTILFEVNNGNQEAPGKTKIDLNTIGTVNLVEKGLVTAQNASKGETGLEEVQHKRTQKMVWDSYGPILSNKFPSSLGWSIISRRTTESLLGSVKGEVRLFYVGLASCFFISVILLFWFSNRIGKSLLAMSDDLWKIVQDNQKMGTSLTSSAQDLSASSTE